MSDVADGTQPFLEVLEEELVARLDRPGEIANEVRLCGLQQGRCDGRDNNRR